MAVLQVEIDTVPWAPDEAKLGRHLGVGDGYDLGKRVVRFVHRVASGVEVVTICAQCADHGPVPEGHCIFNIGADVRGLAERKIAQREDLAENDVGLLAVIDTRFKSVTIFHGVPAAVFDTKAELVIDHIARQALLQVELDATKVLLEAEQAIDGNGA